MFEFRKNILEKRIGRLRSEAFERNFGVASKTFQAAYRARFAEGLSPENDKYPFFRSLEDISIYAYYSCFEIESDKKEILINSITKNFLSEGGHYFRTRKDGKVCRLDVGQRNDFSGVVISLITNDCEVIKQVKATICPPPPPWRVFPDIDPLELGSLQGQVEYWWREFWNPFWNDLTKAEQIRYLKANQVGRDWEDCIRFHA